MPSYSGVWTLTAQYQAIGADNWANPTYWIATLGNPPGDANGRGVAVDSSGNIFVCGYGYNASSDQGVILTKYSSAGSIKWQRTLNGVGTRSDTDQGYAVAVDSSGNIYVTGYWGTDTSAVYDFLLVKYDTSGNVLWQKGLSGGSSAYDTGTSIAIDTTGNVYIAGNTGTSNNNILVVKYNSLGSVQWQRTLTAAGEDFGLGVAVDSSANVYICGASDTSGTYNFQIAKYDTNGTIQWQRSLSGAGGSNDIARAIAVDSSGNVFVCGDGNAAGTYDIYLAKYNTSGTLQWQKRLGSSGGDDYGKGVAIDSSGNVYICGDNSTTSGAQIAKYDTSGTLQWQRSLATAGNYLYGNSIKTDSSGNIYMAGTSGLLNALYVTKLPNDGTLTGTYGTFTYAISSLTNATPTFTSTTSSLTGATSSLSESTTTLANTTGPYTPNRITIA